MTQETRGAERGAGSRSLRFGLFGLLVFGLCLAVDPGLGGLSAETEEILTRAGGVKSAFYLGCYLVSALAMAALMCSPRAWFRWAFLSLVLVASGFEVGLRAVNGYGFELWEATLFVAEAGEAGNALRTYWREFALPLAVAAVLLVALDRLRARYVGEVRISALALVVLGLVPVAAVILRTDGGTSSFPSVFKVPVVMALSRSASIPGAGRVEPFLEPGKERIADHLILVVDESVRGDLLGINGGPAATTPALSAMNILNYGVASSSTNSSAPSNMVLQTGVGIDQLLEDAEIVETWPNVFQYARRAGLRTSLYAAQAIKSWYYISPFDLGLIDNHDLVRERLPDLRDGDIDSAALDRAVRWILDGEDRPSFSYILKMGAHFPYGNKHPRHWDRVRFEDLGPEFGNEERRERMAEYLDAMSWACDEFLRRLAGALEGRSCVVVYTSDHGQSILEGGIRATHGVWKDPPASQASVPIILYGTSPSVRSRLADLARPALAANRDRVSHFEIFPTLLELMGYDRAEIAERYGASLFVPVPADRQRRFFSGDPFKANTRSVNGFTAPR